MSAVFIEGTFCGADKREFTRKADGKKIVVYYNLVCKDSDFYKISSDVDYSGRLQFGDDVRFKVRPNVYNGAIYYNGVLDE